MANVSLGGGLVPVDGVGGRYPRRRHGTPYYTEYNADIGIGDCVVINGTSNTAAIAASGGYVGGAVKFPVGSLRAVDRVAAGANPITGVVLSTDHSPSVAFTTSHAYHVANNKTVLYVDDDPMSIFEIECNATVAAIDIGLNANLDSGATVSTHSGRSNLKLDVLSKGADALKQLTILGVSRALQRNDYSSSSPGPSVYVRINNHTEASNKAGI